MEDNSIARVSFRFDNDSSTDNQELEARIVSLFRGYRVPLTVAVVPFSKQSTSGVLEAKAVPHLIEAHTAGDVEIALHGFRHECRGQDRQRCATEFAGRPFRDQVDMLRRGQAVLRRVFDAPISGFVPPWHSFDQSTLAAAAEIGLSYVAAGMAQKGLPPAPGMPFVIPRTSRFGPSELRLATEEAKLFAPCRPWTVFAFRPAEFIEYLAEPTFVPPRLNVPLLEVMLRRLCGEPALHAVTVHDAVQAQGQDRKERFWSPAELGWIGRLSSGLRKRIPSHVMLRGTRWQALRQLAKIHRGNPG